MIATKKECFHWDTSRCSQGWTWPSPFMSVVKKNHQQCLRRGMVFHNPMQTYIQSI